MEGFDGFVLDVDADEYAEAAAQDEPNVSRTYQSEEQFQAIKAAYEAKHDDGNSYSDLLSQVPVLQGRSSVVDPVRLDKRQIQLLGYAAGELYYNKRYAELLTLCRAIRDRCQCDAKLKAGLDRWTKKCESKAMR